MSFDYYRCIIMHCYYSVGQMKEGGRAGYMAVVGNRQMRAGVW